MTEELRGRAAAAVRAAGRLMEDEGWQDETRLGPAIDELLSLERELIQNEEEFADVFVHVALLIGTRCHLRRDGTTLDPEERAEALRRLRWVDRHGPLDAPLAVLSRMLLIFLLAPWALPRADGSRTALQNALLDVADGRVLTAAVRRDLTEAREVVDRIAGAPGDEEFRRQTESNREIIEQMLAPGTARSARSASGHSTDGADHAAAARNGTDVAPSAQSQLLDAVRGLVDLAGSCGTARFTRVLVWLIAEFSSGRGGDATPDDLTLDLEASRLVRRAGAGRAAGADGVRRAADLALSGLRAVPPDTPQRARVARLHAYLLLEWEFLTGEPADFSEAERPTPDPDGDRADRLADWPIGTAVDPGVLPHLDSHVRDFVAHTGIRERQMAAHLDRLLAYRTGDPGYLDDAAALLGEAIDASPAGSWWGVALQAELVGILEQAAVYGGSFHDADVALVTLRELRAALERDGSVPSDAPFVLDLALSAAGAELSHAQRTGDHAELPRLGEELRGRYAALPPDSDRREKLEERITELDALLPPARQDGRTPGGARAPARPEAAEPEILHRALSELRRDLDDPQLYHDQEYDRRGALGLRMLFDVVRGQGPGELLDEAITELTRVRVLITEGRGRVHRVDVLTKLAEAHLMRAARGGPHRAADQRACIEVFREALGELAADVLLQSGADHGLSAALNGAMLSRRLAFIAFRINRPVDAVADLERGRALVLQSAAATRGIPALLDAAGHPGLARQWRVQVFAHPLRPTAATAPGGRAPQDPDDTPPIPSGLRRKALKALGAGRGAAEGPGTRPLLGATGPAELSAGLAATDTDALVYLVAGVPMADGGFPGRALILRPGTAPVAVALPELLQSGSPPLDRYLEAAAERSRVLTDPEQGPAALAACEGRWQEALGTLCDWAWRAVMGPVLGAVRPLLAAQWPLARPPRIVLVPCGTLGVVPWHAARIRGLGEHGHRYACQEAVLSYAPSGAQFLAAAGRRRMPPATGPQVLVADPELTLPWAELETAALRSACYAGALRYGEFFTADGERDAAGTPEDLLAVLPGGTIPASLVHLSCHAVAAPRPTDSELWLAVPPGAGADAGRLTVADILDASADRRPGAAGPLIVLSACETDLSAGHHDEALTLATTLVTGGAADVVGSRWAVRDGPTSVMMAVFHHHLTARGLAPPDALRAAQLWMLDPHRLPPPTLDGPLRAEAARPDLHRLHHWAAFTHQGNPTASGG
ncbi:CHAT domain-containing protein [Streptomyces sp. NBC_00893]|uniref:CHAT domain-containing protein n=1 Tax=Streptomyces sp. NBC_00893 TaxID=2975862 RepID=UPI0022590B95|nr:CHAT domain-containing protein [Streptomyces sp. NBC_00893]MCX4851184.1 CHAT domain-containing protein [Streptomyces sp. NBC_00893]